jgi:hypothetical protein
MLISAYRIKLLRCCVDEEGGLSRDEESAVVETMCTVCERIKTVSEFHQRSRRERV